VHKSPEDDNDAVKDVESITYVSERPFCGDFEQHFHGEYPREHNVAVLNDDGQTLGLKKAVNRVSSGIII
jgi:hypothetical protein